MAVSQGVLTQAGLLEIVERARRDWLAAQNEFDAVTDPALVDHAIFAMQAAERRYVYLIRLAARLREARPGERIAVGGRAGDPAAATPAEPPEARGAASAPTAS